MSIGKESTPSIPKDAPPLGKPASRNNPLKFLARLIHRLGTRLRPKSREEMVVYLAALGWSVITALLTIGRLWYNDTLWDTGQFNQDLFTALFNHQLFYSSLQWQGPSHSLFAQHFSPVFFLLIPLYALYPAPTTLLVIQAFAMGLAAIPTYRLAEVLTHSHTFALGFGLAYLLNPFSLSVLWTGFHPEALFPLFALAAMYAAQKEDRWAFLIFVTLSLSTSEGVIPMVGAFVLVSGIGEVWKAGSLRSLGQRRMVWTYALGLGLTVAFLGMSMETFRLLSPIGGTLGGAVSPNWSILGASSPLDVFSRAFLYPARAASALVYAEKDKVLYLLLAFGSVAFLPIFGRLRYLIPAMIWCMAAVLSNYGPYYSLGNANQAFLLPFLIAAGVSGGAWIALRVDRYLERPEHWKIHRRYTRGTLFALGAVAVVLSLLTSGVGSPALSSPIANFDGNTGYGVPVPTSHSIAINQVVKLIPAGASVASVLSLFPYVSSRESAYPIPTDPTAYAGLTLAEQIDGQINESQYLLMDYLAGYLPQRSAIFLSQYTNFSRFGLRAADNGVYLYERGWSGKLSLWDPYSIDLPGKDFSLSFKSQGGHPIETFRSPNLDLLPPGRYAVSLVLNLTRMGSPPPGTHLYMSIGFAHHPLVEQPTGSYGSMTRYDWAYGPISYDRLLAESVYLSNSTTSPKSYTRVVTLQLNLVTPGAYFLTGELPLTYFHMQLVSLDVVQLNPSDGGRIVSM